MAFIKVNHAVDTTTTKQVRWDKIEGCFCHDVYDPKQKMSVAKPVENEMVLDVWQASVGWEQFIKVTGRVATLHPIHLDEPIRPEGAKATPIYSIPAYSTEFGGCQELIFQGTAVTQALSDMFDKIKDKLTNKAGRMMVPIIEIENQVTEDFLNAPILHVRGMVDRPAWGKPSVDFSKMT